MEWLDDWLPFGWQVRLDYQLLIHKSSPKSEKKILKYPKTSRVGWCRSQLRFGTIIGMAHLTRAELLRVPLASLSRIKEVRWGGPVDYLQRHNFLRVALLVICKDCREIISQGWRQTSGGGEAGLGTDLAQRKRDHTKIAGQGVNTQCNTTYENLWIRKPSIK